MILNETQPQGVRERVARKIRLPKVHPPTKNIDSTPHRPANNDPTNTSRGRASVRRQGKRNKMHATKFRKEAMKEVAVLDDATIAEWVKGLEDPIAASIGINELMTESIDLKDKYVHINSIIKNVWNNQLIERVAGMASYKNISQELAVFDTAVKMLAEMKDWGIPFCWIERVLNSNVVIYKACGDWPPSKVFIEHRLCEDRHVILSTDRAKIIEIITETNNV